MYTHACMQSLYHSLQHERKNLIILQNSSAMPILASYIVVKLHGLDETIIQRKFWTVYNHGIK